MRENNKYHNQLLFFSALLLSAFGYEFIYFIMTLHIYDLSSSALNIAIFSSLTVIPKLFSNLIGGLSDKIGKSVCLSFSAVMVCILLLTMSVVSDIRLIYGIWFAASFFFTAILNARGALMAEIVSREHYTHGNALALTLLNIARLLGPLLGGFIIMHLNIKVLLYFTCFVYLTVAACAFLIRTVTGNAGNGQPVFLENVKKGFGFILEDQVLRLLASIAFLWRIFLGMQLSLFVILIKTELHGTSAQYGIFVTLMGAGCIAGSLLGPYVSGRMNLYRLISVGLGFHYASFSVLGLCRNFNLSLFIVFCSYMVFYITLVSMHSVRDRVTAFELRGSVYGMVTTMLTPPAIVSMLAGSFLSDHFGASAVLFWAGLLALASLGILLYRNGKNSNREKSSLTAKMQNL